MFFLNLSFVEFMALFTVVSGLVVTLYLLSRSRRRQTVATLRFWVHAKQPVPSSRRRRIQQPWSLILQLLGLALLLLAVAQLKWGTRETASRDHVLLLDNSSWMSARAGRGTLLDEAKAKARAFVRALPSSDRVMVVRVDGLPSPATGMEPDRQTILRAIDDTRPTAAALNLDQAFRFAEQARTLRGSRGGEIVYAGAGRITQEGQPATQPANFRLLEVDTNSENCGLAKIGARRSDATPEQWDIFVEVRNYGGSPRRLPLVIQFGGAPAGSALVDVKPGSSASHTFHFRTRAAGWIEARLLAKDALEDDNRAIVELPPLKTIKVAVFSDDPDSLRPALSTNPQVQAAFYSPSEYGAKASAADVLIFDRWTPPGEPKANAIWIEPPAGAPFRVRSTLTEPKQVRWRTDHEIAAGLRTRELRLTTAQLFSPAKGDIPIAEVDGGPVALLRSERRFVALGFHPGRTEMRFDLATPLLIANILRSIDPDAYRTSEVHGGTVGTVTTPVDAADAANLRVLADGKEIPYTVAEGKLRFFSGSPSVVRVLSGGREQVYSLSLPEVATQSWNVPPNIKRGTPGMVAQAVSGDLWQILAALGAIVLVIEWMMYGRRRTVKAPASRSTDSATAAAAMQRAS